MTTPFRPFDLAREGDRPSAEFLRRMQEEALAARQVTAAHPLTASTTPTGTDIRLDRTTLDHRRFVLTEALNKGGSAEAKILYFDPADEDAEPTEGEVFTVYDPMELGGMAEGDRGVAAFSPDTGRWELVAIGGGEFFLAEVTEYNPETGQYAFAEHRFLPDGDSVLKDEGRTGTAGAYVRIVTTVQGDSDTQEVQVITISNATSETWTLGATSLDWDASTAEVQSAVDAAVGGSTAVVTGSGPYTVTWVADGVQAELTVSGAGLRPKAVTPAYELNDDEITVPSMEWMRVGHAGEPLASCEKTQTGDGVSTHTKFEIVLQDYSDGTYSFTTGSGTSADLDYSADNSEVDTAISATGEACNVSGGGTADPFIVTFNDTADHTLTLDAGSLVPAGDYRFKGCMRAMPTYECPDDSELVIDGGTW